MAIESTAFPWLKHLPEDAAREFFEELSEKIGEAQLHHTPGVLVSAEHYVGYLDPLIAAWKTTAEVYADPELLEALTRDHDRDDFEDAPRPERGPSADLVIVDEIQGMPRLLDCGFCYEENGEEVHPHPQCTKGRKPSKARKLCSAKTVPFGGTATLWCNKFADHTGDHITRTGYRWPSVTLGDTVPRQREGVHENDDI